MLSSAFTVSGFVFGIAIAMAAMAEDQKLNSYVAARIGEFDQISADRQAALAKVTAYVKAQADGNRIARLTFVCTHNSRRSQMGQI